MHIDHDTGAAACLDGLETFVRVVETLDDDQLMASSRCRGWTVADLLVHVHLALSEMLHGLVSPTDARPDTDAASYWRADPPSNDPGADEIDQIRFVRVLSGAYRRPSGIVGHLRPTAIAVATGVRNLGPGAVCFQNRVLSTGDFLATWATEVSVHHLDLTEELDPARPAPSALAVARQTVEVLAGGRFPPHFDDARVVLVGAGRLRLGPDDDDVAAEVARRLPVLG